MVDSNESTQDDPLSAVLSQLASPDNLDPELQAVDDDQDMQDILDALLELQRLEGQEGDLFDQDNLTISYAISLNQELQREAERQVALIDQQMKLVIDRLVSETFFAFSRIRNNSHCIEQLESHSSTGKHLQTL